MSKSFKTIKTSKRSQGFGLLEVVISCGILIIFIAGAVGLARVALQNSVISSERVQAYLLAEEALETVRQIRDTTWVDQAIVTVSSVDQANEWNSPFLSNVADPSFLKCSGSPSNCNINYNIANSKWEIVDSAQPESVILNDKTFTRSIFMYNVDTRPDDPLPSWGLLINWPPYPGSMIRVTAKVSWNEYNKDWEVFATTLLSDWKPGY